MRTISAVILALLILASASVDASAAQKAKSQSAKPFDYQKCYDGMIARGQRARDAGRFCGYKQRDYMRAHGGSKQ
jgi:hypothetical protein